MWSNTKVILLSVTLSCVGIGIGVLIGYFSYPNPENVEAPDNVPPPPPPEEDLSIVSKLMNEMSAKNIRDNLEQITKRPHIAGRDVDEVDLVNLIKSRWTEAGIDSVVVYPYEVLLSYPKQNDSNYVAIVDAAGNESDVSQRKELVIDEEQNDPDVVDPFNAYSPPGQLEGEIVYVNYATIDDFMELNRTLKISTQGKICISRYGSIFRGDKADHAYEYGCKGLILYSDPKDYAVPWAGVYPDDWFLPPTGAQRGTLWVENGDPRTPNYPSIPTAWHAKEENRPLPKLPVTPIGYIDAIKYLSKMAGDEVKEEWRGGLNITYRYGPGFQAPYNESEMKMSVKTENEVATTHNVIGYIRGSTEPDRYVLLGNHRDAWVFGAIDPSSGTASLIEMVRAFGVMLKQGWRPRRTLVFCSWGAEEYGLIGSQEWVEELQKELEARAIVYINVDSAVSGNFTLRGGGSPNFRDALFEAAKAVPNPDPTEIAMGRERVYDTWKLNVNDVNNPDYPVFGGLGSGSDYAPFLQILGISAIDFRYTYDSSIGIASYPVYHSIYETFELVSDFVDPDFVFHRAVAQLWGEIGRKVADSVILPVNCKLYAEDLGKKRDALKDVYGDSMTAQGINLGDLDKAIANFSTAAEKIHQRIQDVDTNNLMQVRAINDQLMQLERAFIDQSPLPGRTDYRHVISAPSQHNTYGESAFPGVTDAMFDIEVDPDQEGRWDEVKRQYSILLFHIISAAATLDPFVPE